MYPDTIFRSYFDLRQCCSHKFFLAFCYNCLQMKLWRSSSIYCLVYRDKYRTSPRITKFCNSYLFNSIKGWELIIFAHVLQVAKMSVTWQYSVDWLDGREWIINWTGYRRRESWPNFKVQTQHICGGSEEKHSHSHEGWYPSTEWNQTSP